MDKNSEDGSPIRHWSALVPIGMSLAALALVVYAALVGTQPQEDEGAAAHIYQLLMTAQMPIVAFFAIKWLPRKTRQALLVLVLQGAAWFAALGTLYFFEHR